MESLPKFRFLIIAVLFWLQFTGAHHPVSANNESVRFSENVNLALRRTAHLLLKANGDSLSTIPPVSQTDGNTFTVRLNQVFEYDQLPALLQKSLELYGITNPYHVAILDCNTSAVQLGYSFFDLKQEGGVPCGGRQQMAGCYNLQVTFDKTKEASKAGAEWWLLPFGSIMALLGFMFWRRSRKDHAAEVRQTIPDKALNSGLSFGNSQLDLDNLVLYCASTAHNLTYREAKLLNFFVINANQILERDRILKSVWEDEGVIVGRSVDVFVSRLRKMLTNDPQVKIAAVHGIGYRMEVSR